MWRRTQRTCPRSIGPWFNQNSFWNSPIFGARMCKKLVTRVFCTFSPNFDYFSLENWKRASHELGQVQAYGLDELAKLLLGPNIKLTSLIFGPFHKLLRSLNIKSRAWTKSKLGKSALFKREILPTFTMTFLLKYTLVRLCLTRVYILAEKS